MSYHTLYETEPREELAWDASKLLRIELSLFLSEATN